MQRIAHKHVSLGVKPEQYPIIGGALLSAIQEVAYLPDDHPALLAWGEAYGVLADVLIKAEEDIYQQNEEQQGGWRGFREFVIDDIVAETDNVKSFYLKPKDGQDIPGFKGGQYIGVKADLEDQQYTQIRQYSLSAESGKDYLRITTKAEPSGLVSNYMHQCELGSSVHIQAPTGVFNLDKEAKNHILIAGGVGITPLMSMLYQALAEGVDPKHILFIQAQHAEQNEIYKQELAELKAKYGFHYRAHFSGDEHDFINESRLKNWSEQAGIGILDNTAVYFCGPKPFMSAMKQACVSLGVSEAKMHYEVFGPTTGL